MLCPRIEDVGSRMGLLNRSELLDQAPSSLRDRNAFLSYFSLLGRRKQSWGEVLRFSEVREPYPQHVWKKQLWQSKKTL